MNTKRTTLVLAALLWAVVALPSQVITYATLDDPLAGPNESSPSGISGNNIVGGYTDASFVGHGFLATVPEHSTFVLAALCFLSMVAWRRRGLLAGLLVVAAMLTVSDARADFAYAWGDNETGELGDGTQINRSTPTPVSALGSGVTVVAGGQYYGLAVQNGGAYAWGDNTDGQLGDGTGVRRLLPVAVSSLGTGVTAVAAGVSHSMAIQNGAVYAWGYNGFGSLGDGTTNPSVTPVAVSAPLTSGVTAIAVGDQFSLAIKNGGVWAWGTNEGGELGNGTMGLTPNATPAVVTGLASGVTSIVAGYTDSLAVKNGGVYFWGDGQTIPVAVTGLGSGVTAVADGRYHSLAVRNGSVYAWGLNGSGALGDGTVTSDYIPEQIDPADLHNIIAVAAGQNSSYALSKDGSLWVWGFNGNGALGLGNFFQDQYLTPQHLLPPNGFRFTSINANAYGASFALATLAPVPEPAAFVLATLGFLGMITLRRHSLVACVLIATAAFAGPEARADVAYAWGDNVYGQLGDGTQIDRSTPASVTGLASGVTAVAAGYEHSLAVQNGGVYAWGYDGATADSYTPVAVSGLSSGVTAIAGGGLFSLAVQNGGVYTWGYNGAGQLGNGTTSSGSSTPVAVIGMSSGVTAIAGGAAHSLAIKNGVVYAWGANGAGQLGNGTTTGPSTPVAVTGLSSGVTSIAAGGSHSLAVRNGVAYAWGSNGFGQLGDGTTNDSSTPVAVTGLTSGVTSIAGGEYFSLAAQNGGVYTWGSSYYGQLGDGTTTTHLTPERIDPADLHNIIEVTAAGYSSYALSSDGSLWVWGHNGFYALGLGIEAADYLTPQHLLAPGGYRFTSIDADSAGYHAIATLAAVPEPATFMLAALGFLSLLACNQQRCRRSPTCFNVQKGSVV